MPLKWQSLSQDSASAQQPAVPFGSPEGHFPDQLNNIARETAAAVAEMGSALFSGTDANGASTTTPALSDGLKQFLYDMAHPVNSMLMWDSNSGVNPITEHIPSGVTATWSECDGTGTTPDLRSKVLGGADPTGTIYTGDVIGDASTGADGGFTPTGTIGGTAISIANLPVHSHTISHSHSMAHTHTVANVLLNNTGLGFGAGGPLGESYTGDTSTGGSSAGSTGGSSQGSSGNKGSGTTHTHTFTGDAEANHTHTMDPTRTLVEIYKRTA
jgi:hypothetical protein